MSPKEILLTLPLTEDTAALAARIAPCLAAGDTLLLQGVVGAGKSVFARALVQALTSPAQEVPSPSFTLVQEYETSGGALWHADLYRLGDMSELDELGLFDAMDSAICLIEWPERLGDDTPARHLRIALSIPDPAKDTREAVLAISGDWPKLEGLL